jgi:hypothetical protein
VGEEKKMSLKKIPIIVFILCVSPFPTNQSVRHGFSPTLLHSYHDPADAPNSLWPQIIDRADSGQQQQQQQRFRRELTTSTGESRDKLANLNDRNGNNANISVKVSAPSFQQDFNTILCGPSELLNRTGAGEMAFRLTDVYTVE